MVPLKKENGQTALVPRFPKPGEHCWGGMSLVALASIDPIQGKKVEHNGVKIHLLGHIEIYFDRGIFMTTHPWVSDHVIIGRELYVPWEIHDRKHTHLNSLPLEFLMNPTMEALTYNRSYIYTVYYTPLDAYLHYLMNIIIGKIYFLVVRIKIKTLELEIRRRESTGSGMETLAKFELMDGAPVRVHVNRSLFQLFLSPYNVTPTYGNINNKFNIKYYLNLVLVDEDHSYITHQEITVNRLQADN
ncbi:hypothetical protein AMTRI_Chr03g143210 [Amborella trichopoda]